MNVIYMTSPEQKRLSKSAAKQYIFGSPKLRDVLRKKFGQRIKEARKDNFDNVRNKFLLQIEEISQLEKDIELEDIVFKEILQEAYEWLIEDIENQEKYIFDAMENIGVFCPICQKSELKERIGELNCKCGVNFQFSGSLEKFQDITQQCLFHHNSNGCNHNLIFFLDPVKENRQKLNTFCDNCDFYFVFN